MTTAYPGALDDFTNPQSTDRLTTPSHAAQHANLNDAVEAIEATLGVNPQGDEATVSARIAALEGGGGGGAAWGGITGTLSDQTDLQAALDAKLASADVTTTPSASKVPEAGGDGKIDVGWLPGLPDGDVLEACDVGLPGWQILTTTTSGASVLAGQAYLVPIFPSVDIVIDRIETNVAATPGAGTVLDVSVWECDIVNGVLTPHTRIFEQTGVDISATGFVALLGLSIQLEARKVYAVVGVSNGAITLNRLVVNRSGHRSARATNSSLQIVMAYVASTGYPAPSTWAASVTASTANGAVGYRAQFALGWT